VKNYWLRCWTHENFLKLSGLRAYWFLHQNWNFVNIWWAKTNITAFEEICQADFECVITTKALQVALDQVRVERKFWMFVLDEGNARWREFCNGQILKLIAFRTRNQPYSNHDWSSKWSIIVAGLKCVQGRGCELYFFKKNGKHEEFIFQAKTIRKFGSGSSSELVAWKKDKQTPTSAGIENLWKMLRTLVDVVKFNPQDIIFDPNIFSGLRDTGMDEHKKND